MSESNQRTVVRKKSGGKVTTKTVTTRPVRLRSRSRRGSKRKSKSKGKVVEKVTKVVSKPPKSARKMRVMNRQDYLSQQKIITSRYASRAPSGLKSEEMQILKNIMLPYAGPPSRISPPGEVYAPPQTAVARHNIVLDFNIQRLLDIPTDELLLRPEIEKGQLVWSAPDHISMVQLQDLYVPVIYPSYVGDADGQYSCSFWINENYTTGNTPYFSQRSVHNFTETTIDWDLQPLNFTQFSPSLEWPQVIPCHTLHDGRYFWVDASPEASATIFLDVTPRFGCVIEEGKLYVSVYRLVPGTYGAGAVAESDEAVVPGVVTDEKGVAAIDLDYSGYYRVVLHGVVTHLADNPVALSVAARLTMTTSIATVHYVNADADNFGIKHAEFKPNFDSVQVLGSSLLWQNLTPAIMKGGSTTGYSWNGRDGWWDLTGLPTSKLTTRNKTQVYTGLWEDGMYGYVRPISVGYDRFTESINQQESVDSSASTAYYNVTDCIDPVGPEPKFPSCRGMNVYRITPPVATPGQTSFGSASARVVLTIAFEFATTNQNFNLMKPRIGPTLFLETHRKFINGIIPFDKNSTHETDIWSTIKGFVFDAKDVYGHIKGLLDIGGKYMKWLL